jgi:hypothetical protein
VKEECSDVVRRMGETNRAVALLLLVALCLPHSSSRQIFSPNIAKDSTEKHKQDCPRTLHVVINLIGNILGY